MCETITSRFSKETLEMLKKVRLCDDSCARVGLKGRPDAVGLILRELLEDDSIFITNVVTQFDAKSLIAHSSVYDIWSIARGGRIFVIEFQSELAGDETQRNGHYADMAGSETVPAGVKDYRVKPELTVVVITGGDVFGKGLPVYTCTTRANETGEEVDDRRKVIYINRLAPYDGSRRSKMLWDLGCSDPDAMGYTVLRKLLANVKDVNKGDNLMCKVIEETYQKGCKVGFDKGHREGFDEGHDKGHREGFDEGTRKTSISIARNLKTTGKFTDPEIANIANLPVAVVISL